RPQTPTAPYGAELLALRRGTYPTSPRQVAVTDGVAESLRLEIGSTLALDGVRRKVVGIVENPRRLSDEFVLLPPSSASTSDYVDVLVDANEESLDGGSLGGALQNMRIKGNDEGGADTLALVSVATGLLLLG